MQTNKYTKLPVDVEAVEFTGGRENGLEIETWINSNEGNSAYSEAREAVIALGSDEIEKPAVAEGIRIGTLEGVVRASVGDFIIKGVEGEFYPCKPSVFSKSYKAKEQTPAPRTPPETFKKPEGQNHRSEDKK